MATLDELTALRDYSSSVVECVDSLVVPSESVSICDSLRERAALVEREATEPLRIGLVGEFSAGKSLWLNVVMGRPDLLPTSANPTTGNVTELHFTQAADRVSTTELGDVEVCYLPSADLSSMERLLLRELRAEAVRAGLAATDIDWLGTAAEATLTEVRSWCERAWRGTDNVAVRKLVREWWLTREAAHRAPDWLGKRLVLPERRLPEVLLIDYPAVSEGVPAPRAGVVRWTGSPTPADLGSTFPLIDRVVLHVRIPREVWDISAIRTGDEFVLLDFPGIGGDLTRARDLFLTRRGLTDVHTVVVLVNAARPGGQAPEKFYGFLRELDADTGGDLSKRLLYCAGMFDLLNPPSLADLGSSRTTQDRLLDASAPLKTLLGSGHQPGTDQIEAFLSSVMAIHAKKLNGAPAELGLQFHESPAVKKAESWQAIAEAMTADGTGRDLARRLVAYAKDGGLDFFRALVQDHVRDHGLELRLQRVNELVDALEEMKEELQRSLREHAVLRRPGAGGPDGSRQPTP